MSRLTIIVAATVSNGIGYQSQLPWRLPKEMKYFAQATTTAPEGRRNAVIMGRNTWESIPKKFRPLNNRVNYVTSHNEGYKLVPVSDTAPSHLCTSLESALGHIANSKLSDKPIHKAFVIGGASLYTESLQLSLSNSAAVVDRILLTRVLQPEFECDVFMPDFQKEGNWKRATHDELEAWVEFEVPNGVQRENGVEYEFQMWTREV